MTNMRWFWLGLGVSVVVGFLLILGIVSSTEAGTFEFLSPSAYAAYELPTPLATGDWVPPTITSSQLVAPVDSVLPIGASSQPVPPPAEPPLPDQGGDCIVGSVIDIYHQFTGIGWKVTATSAQAASFVTTVNAEGLYRFPDLTGGVWTVALDVPVNWQPFTPASFKVTLSGDPNQGCAQVRHKVIRPACLDILKLDAQDTGGIKFGIPGWRMTATNPPDTLTEVTDAKGEIHFSNMRPGTWTVTEEDKLGWTLFHRQVNPQVIVLPSPRGAGMCGQITFINHQIHTADIRVCKLGVPTDEPLRDWVITVTRDDGTQPPMTKATGRDGCTVFENLALGAWTVTEQVKPGWRPVGPITQTVNLTLPGHEEKVIFKNEFIPMGCIDGFKINHLDQGLPNWTITALSQDTGQSFSTQTDPAGHFQIEVPLGKWKVYETMQTGWEPITPPELEVNVTKQLPVCEHVRFKNKTNYACVDVFKKDAFLNSGLPGWEITVQPAYGGIPRVDSTDGTGFVRFNGLTPGTYVISETMQNGWTPVTPTSVQLTLNASGSCPVVNFQNRQTNAPFPVPPPPKPRPCRTTHRVTWGNSFGTIAAQYGTTVEAIKSANGLKSNSVSVGQQLCIP